MFLVVLPSLLLLRSATWLQLAPKALLELELRIAHDGADDRALSRACARRALSREGDHETEGLMFVLASALRGFLQALDLAPPAEHGHDRLRDDGGGR